MNEAIIFITKDADVLTFIFLVLAYIYGKMNSYALITEGFMKRLSTFFFYGGMYLTISLLMVPLSQWLSTIPFFSLTKGSGLNNGMGVQPHRWGIFHWALTTHSQGVVATHIWVFGYIIPVYIAVRRIWFLITGTRAVIDSEEYDEHDLIIFLRKHGIKVKTREGPLGYTVSGREGRRLHALKAVIQILSEKLGYKNK